MARLVAPIWSRSAADACRFEENGHNGLFFRCCGPGGRPGFPGRRFHLPPGAGPPLDGGGATCPLSKIRKADCFTGHPPQTPPRKHWQCRCLLLPNPALSVPATPGERLTVVARNRTPLPPLKRLGFDDLAPLGSYAPVTIGNLSTGPRILGFGSSSPNLVELRPLILRTRVGQPRFCTARIVFYALTLVPSYQYVF